MKQIAEAQRLARAWDAAHPREPHCTRCPPAVGLASTPRHPEERCMKPPTFPDLNREEEQ